ncbi:MAG: hypothetical protein DWQ31_04510 [Planctomycetota bacterium]|nr:MAG: hypothetical protein DWQ31_04510 [Planctomycetota bacterium]REJ95592.1 MAG: hypothetical protein DWQ35_06340 [Planctomycetota bacterium]
MVNTDLVAAALPLRFAWLAALVVVVLVPVVDSRAAAADTVWYRTGGSESREARRGGKIVQYDNGGLRVETLAGRDVTIPAERVVRIEYDKTKAQQSAEEAFAQGDFGDAYRYYRVVLRDRDERRDWVRSRVMADAIRCRIATGDYDDAGDLFARLAERGADLVYFEQIPLAWTAAATVKERIAEKWLNRSEAATVQLLAASHLTRSSQRDRALALLRDLAAHENRDLARLASARLWLTQLPTATESDLVRWKATVEKLPERLRVGPYYVLGRGYALKKQYEQAALTLMRVPVQFPLHRDLGAESLLIVGSALAELGRADEAERVLREVVEDHADSLAAQEATQRLGQLRGTP